MSRRAVSASFGWLARPPLRPCFFRSRRMGSSSRRAERHAMGKFILTQMAAVAELEAGLIGERTKAALAAAKQPPVTSGKSAKNNSAGLCRQRWPWLGPARFGRRVARRKQAHDLRGR
jgi:hypothetical protein